MTVKALGYVVVETTNRDRWDHFLTQVVGAMRAPDALDGSALYRIDARPFRFRIEQGASDRLVAAGYEVADAASLARLAEAVRAAGRPVTIATPKEAAARCVAALLRTSDPAGNGLEFFYGDQRDDVKFVSRVGVPGFIAGDLGMGHAVLAAPNFAACHAFYRDVIGFRDTDLPEFHLMGPEAPALRFAFMHAENGRHHSVALGEGPVPPSGCIHLMLELPDLVEVGKAHDRMREAGYPESATLGRHVNDEMTSFYVQTPAGFDLEIGCGGLVIDPDNWQVTRHEEISVWGHVWAWLTAAKETAQ